MLTLKMIYSVQAYYTLNNDPQNVLNLGGTRNK